MKLEIPPRLSQAYLFDCDGTIVDSMLLHYIAWKRALSKQGRDFSEDLSEHLSPERILERTKESVSAC